MLSFVAHKSTLPVNYMVVAFTRLVVVIIFRIETATDRVRTGHATLWTLIEAWTSVEAIYN